MKLPRLIALHYGLAAILMASTLTVYADAPKKEMVEAQQQEAVDAINASKKANPYNEQRPAANSSQHKHSTESPKGSMIKEQKKATVQGIEDTEASKPTAEARPAAVTSQKKHSAQSSKGEVIKSQKKAVEKELSDAEAAKKSPVPATAVN
jgi:hypothetical protein